MLLYSIQSDNERLQAQVHHLKESSAVLRQQNEEVHRRLDDEKKRASDSRLENEERIKELQETIDSLRRRLRDSDSHAEALNAEIVSVEARVGDAQTGAERYRHLLLACEREKTELSNALRMASERNKNLKVENDRRIAEVGALIQGEAETRAVVEQAMKRLDYLDRIVVEKDQQATAWKARAESLEERLHRLEDSHRGGVQQLSQRLERWEKAQFPWRGIPRNAQPGASAHAPAQAP